jgi:hypothetical protein
MPYRRNRLRTVAVVGGGWCVEFGKKTGKKFLQRMVIEVAQPLTILTKSRSAFHGPGTSSLNSSSISKSGLRVHYRFV